MKPPLTIPNVEKASHPAPHIDKVLNLVDRIAESLGLNVAQIVKINQLRGLAPETFGYTLADFLDREELSPFTTGPRRKQLHDSVHVLTGYGIDYVGEAEVQAFLLGAKFRLINILLGLGLLKMIHRQLAAAKSYPYHLIWQRLWCAYKRGRNSQFDPDTWQAELLWELPLTQVQAQFNL